MADAVANELTKVAFKNVGDIKIMVSDGVKPPFFASLKVCYMLIHHWSNARTFLRVYNHCDWPRDDDADDGDFSLARDAKVATMRCSKALVAAQPDCSETVNHIQVLDPADIDIHNPQSLMSPFYLPGLFRRFSSTDITNYICFVMDKTCKQLLRETPRQLDLSSYHEYIFAQVDHASRSELSANVSSPSDWPMLFELVSAGIGSAPTDTAGTITSAQQYDVLRALKDMNAIWTCAVDALDLLTTGGRSVVVFLFALPGHVAYGVAFKETPDADEVVVLIVNGGWGKDRHVVRDRLPKDEQESRDPYCFALRCAEFSRYVSENATSNAKNGPVTGSTTLDAMYGPPHNAELLEAPFVQQHARRIRDQRINNCALFNLNAALAMVCGADDRAWINTVLHACIFLSKVGECLLNYLNRYCHLSEEDKSRLQHDLCNLIASFNKDLSKHGCCKG
jgi:hypothetical protein